MCPPPPLGPHIPPGRSPWARLGALIPLPSGRKSLRSALVALPFGRFFASSHLGALVYLPSGREGVRSALVALPFGRFFASSHLGPLSPSVFPIAMLSSAPFRTNRANSSPFWPLAMYPLHPKLRAADTGGPPLRPTPLSSYPSSVFAELPTFRLKSVYVSTLHRFPARIFEGEDTRSGCQNFLRQKGLPGGLWGDQGSPQVPWEFLEGLFLKTVPSLRLGKPFPTQGVSREP